MVVTSGYGHWCSVSESECPGEKKKKIINVLEKKGVPFHMHKEREKRSIRFVSSLTGSHDGKWI